MGNASHQVLIERLPPSQALPLRCCRGRCNDEWEIHQFVPQLEIPLGTIFTFFVAAEADGTSELHKREFGGVGGVDDDDENHDHDEDRDYEHDGSGGDVLPPSM